MNNTELLLSDIRLTLLRIIKQVNPTSLEASFMLWACPALTNTIRVQLPSDWSVLNYQHVAQLGFLTEKDYAIPNRQSDLINGLTRLLGRPTTVVGGSRAPFTTDVIALIGIAAGAKLVGGPIQEGIADWIAGFIQETCKELPLWKRCVAFAAYKMLCPDQVCSLSISGGAGEVRTALNQVGVGIVFQEDETQSVFSSLTKEVIEDDEQDPCLAALRFRTLLTFYDSSPTISLNKPTTSNLISFLERIPAAFRRWTWEEKPKTTTSTLQRWDIQNEYHVQNLLYLLLSPIFPDLEDEFYFDPIGQKNARADLGIPSLGLIIEVKFLRSSVRFADMVEEVAADNSLYFGKNSEYTKRYQTMMAFVWDDSRRDIEHDVFKRGVNQLSHIVGSVVISRPGNMPHRKM